MNRNFTVLLIFILCLVVISPLMSDEKEDVKNAYNQGKSKLESGDIKGAITDLESVYNSGVRPYNLKAQNLLVEAYDKKGQKLIDNKKYDEALVVYKKAYKLNPNDQNIKNKYYGLKDGSLQKSLTKTTTTTTIAVVNNSDSNKQNSDNNQSNVKKTIITNQVNNEEVKKLKTEINEQKKIIDRLERQYLYSSRKNNSNNNSAIIKQNNTMLELLKSYNDTIKKLKEDSANNKNKEDFYQKQLEEQKILLKKQQSQSRNIIITTIFSVSGLILLLLLLFFIILLIVRKRNIRQKQQYANFDQQIVYGVNQNEQVGLAYRSDNNSQSQYLISEDSLNVNVDNYMYKDLLKMDRLNKLQEQIKRDNIQWDTVREYIHDLEKDIRTEILNLVERKLESGEIMDFSSVIEVLFPFLTDGDDYIREKSSSLIKKSITEVKKDIKTGYNYDIVNKEIIKKLRDFAKKSDKVTGRINHSINVANYAKGIAKTINLSKDDQELIYQAGLAHDAGFLLCKEKDIAFIAMHKDIEEKHIKIIKEHVAQSIEFLGKNNIDLPKKVIEGILTHHEKLDGSGYPDKVKTENIPVYGKILGIADAFDAMTSNRVYRDKLDFTTALAVLKNEENKLYDAKYVEALIEFIKQTGKVKE